MTSGKTISENIKKARTKLGLTQDDLAKKADIKYTTLMKVESGAVNKPSVQTMAKIAKALVFARPRFPPPPNFVFRFAKCAAQEICLIVFILFGSIAIRVITLYTIILPKLYLYDKWKNNQRKYQGSARQAWLNPRRFSQEGGY